MSDWMIRETLLDSTQKQFLNMDISNSSTIIGCAGSGKSLLALHKARHIQSQNQSYSVIVFTRALKNFFNGGVIDLNLNANCITTYAAWSKRVVDYIIVDEAQDFSSDEIIEIKKVAKKGVYFFGDDAQQIYLKLKDVVSSMNEVAHISSTPIINLITNHRMTKEVAIVAECLNVGKNIYQSCYKKGEKPFLIQLNPCEDEVDFIISVIQNQNLTDIAILLPTNQAVTEYKEIFNQKGFFVEINTKDTRDLNFRTPHPKIMTYHSAKGLQFDTVFMPNVDKLETYQNAQIYVAITRSSNDLYLLSSTGRPKIFRNASRSIFNIPNTPSDYGFEF